MFNRRELLGQRRDDRRRFWIASARQKSCGPGSGGRDEPPPKKVNFIPPEQQQQKPTVLKAALNIGSRHEAMTYALADLHEKGRRTFGLDHAGEQLDLFIPMDGEPANGFGSAHGRHPGTYGLRPPGVTARGRGMISSSRGARCRTASWASSSTAPRCAGRSARRNIRRWARKPGTTSRPKPAAPTQCRQRQARVPQPVRRRFYQPCENPGLWMYRPA